MERSTIRPLAVSVGSARPPAWILALTATIAYVALIGSDVYVGRIPLKLFLVGGTLAAWWMSSEVRPSLGRYRFAVPVLALGIATPLIWTAVAAANAAIGDSVARHEFGFTIQNASRFAYVLLYFPLIDLGRKLGRPAVAIWLIPVYAICFITAAIWFNHLITGEPVSTAKVLIFEGAVGDVPEGYRVFIGNQILLVPAFALLLAQLATSGWSPARFWGLTALVATAFMAHTRGIWLGLAVLCAVTLVLLLLRIARPAIRPALAAGVVAAMLAGLTFGGLVLAGAIDRPGFLGDQSTSVRVEQSGPLWDGFQAHPVLGSGLGAVLDSGFERNEESPWSFELTYLQILFQMGIVGLAFVLWLPVAVIWTAGREILRSPGIRAGPLAAVGGLMGILVSSGTNPYLLANFGMLSLIIAVTLAEPAEDQERG